jgi:metal transporter CNNM
MFSNTVVAGGRTNYNGYTGARPAILGFAKLLCLGLCQVSHTAAVPLSEASATRLRIFLGATNAHEHLEPSAGDASVWLYLGIAAVLVLLGGAFAGLTIA